MTEALRQKIRRQANYRCEYCHTLERHLPFAAFHLDHIVARQHGGADEELNLAWSCHSCNLHKGTNLSSADPDTREIVRIYNRRVDKWGDHFQIEAEFIRGKTSTGRATVWLLELNSAERRDLRVALRALGEWQC